MSRHEHFTMHKYCICVWSAAAGASDRKSPHHPDTDFGWRDLNTGSWWVSVQKEDNDKAKLPDIDHKFSLSMLTSNELGSGIETYRANGPFQMQILPRYRLNVGPLHNYSQIIDVLHSSLRREDGESFVVLFKGGQTKYKAEVRAPFFATPSPDPGAQSEPIFISDRE